MASMSAAACLQLGALSCISGLFGCPAPSGCSPVWQPFFARGKGSLQWTPNQWRRPRSRRHCGHLCRLNTLSVLTSRARGTDIQACTLDEPNLDEATEHNIVVTSSPQSCEQEVCFGSKVRSWPSNLMQAPSSGSGWLQKTVCFLATGQVLIGQLHVPESAAAAALDLEAQSTLSVTAAKVRPNPVLSRLSFVDMPKAGSPDVGQTSLFSAENEELAADLFEKLSPSVVSIQDVKVAPAGRGGRSEPKIVGQGSGFIWDSYGHVVTNYHVVAKLATDPSGLQRTTVTVKGKGKAATVFEATLVGGDSFRDIAVLKIDPSGAELQPLPIGTSNDLQVGQSCYAIGNPFGFGQTLTTGIVSGLDRMIPSPSGKPIAGAIQTDAAINAGNSGGPLLDSFGRLIGVNTATFTRAGTGQSSGVNFAIPVDVVYRIVPRLIVYGSLNYENGLKP